MRALFVLLVGLLAGSIGTLIYAKQNPAMVTGYIPSPTPAVLAEESATPSASAPTVSIPSGIEVSSPTSSRIVSSPLSVRGWAMGNWFTAGEVRARIVDENLTELASTTVKASASTSSSYIPFSGTVTFSTPATDEGYLILEQISATPSTDGTTSGERVLLHFR